MEVGFGKFKTKKLIFCYCVTHCQGDEVITIRAYEGKKDREALIRMYKAFSPGDRTLGLPPDNVEDLKKWIENLSKSGISLLAELDGKVVAHLAAVPEGSEIHLMLFVHPEYQNNGIGQKMVSFVVEQLKDSGYERLIVTTDRTNKKAIHVFEKAGFIIKSVGFEYEMCLPLFF